MRKGFGFHDRHSPFRLNPATFFVGGTVAGTWYDPSDLGALFQDSAGTTPVTGVEQVVGLMLDKSGNGNHATATGAARPTLSARVNLLTKTEQFNDAAVWTKTIAGDVVSPNAAVAPDGTMTAEKFVPDTTNSQHRLIQTVSATAANNVISIYAKADGYNWIILQGSGFAWFDVANGVVGTQTSSTGSITPVGNGWYRCTLVLTSSTTNVAVWVVNGNNVTSFAGNGTGGVIIWGSDLRATNESANIPSYQKVNTSTDYDTVGFPLYLRFSSGQAITTPSNLNLSSTDKITVWAGLRKLSDAATGVPFAFGNAASQAGSFELQAPSGASANYSMQLRGDSGVGGWTYATYVSPITNVFSSAIDLSNTTGFGTNKVVSRFNGVVNSGTWNTGNAGVGNFGSWPLSIGARATSFLFFNGRLYGLIVLGAAASSWQIQVTEQWMAGKTGLQF